MESDSDDDLGGGGGFLAADEIKALRAKSSTVFPRSSGGGNNNNNNNNNNISNNSNTIARSKHSVTGRSKSGSLSSTDSNTEDADADAPASIAESRKIINKYLNMSKNSAVASFNFNNSNGNRNGSSLETSISKKTGIASKTSPSNRTRVANNNNNNSSSSNNNNSNINNNCNSASSSLNRNNGNLVSYPSSSLSSKVDDSAVLESFANTLSSRRSIGVSKASTGFNKSSVSATDQHDLDSEYSRFSAASDAIINDILQSTSLDDISSYVFDNSSTFSDVGISCMQFWTPGNAFGPEDGQSFWNSVSGNNRICIQTVENLFLPADISSKFKIETITLRPDHSEWASFVQGINSVIQSKNSLLSEMSVSVRENHFQDKQLIWEAIHLTVCVSPDSTSSSSSVSENKLACLLVSAEPVRVQMQYQQSYLGFLTKRFLREIALTISYRLEQLDQIQKTEFIKTTVNSHSSTSQNLTDQLSNLKLLMECSNMDEFYETAAAYLQRNSKSSFVWFLNKNIKSNYKSSSQSPSQSAQSETSVHGVIAFGNSKIEHIHIDSVSQPKHNSSALLNSLCNSPTSSVVTLSMNLSQILQSVLVPRTVAKDYENEGDDNDGPCVLISIPLNCNNKLKSLDKSSSSSNRQQLQNSSLSYPGSSSTYNFVNLVGEDSNISTLESYIILAVKPSLNISYLLSSFHNYLDCVSSLAASKVTHIHSKIKGIVHSISNEMSAIVSAVEAANLTTSSSSSRDACNRNSNIILLESFSKLLIQRKSSMCSTLGVSDFDILLSDTVINHFNPQRKPSAQALACGYYKFNKSDGTLDTDAPAFLANTQQRNLDDSDSIRIFSKNESPQAQVKSSNSNSDAIAEFIKTSLKAGSSVFNTGGAMLISTPIGSIIFLAFDTGDEPFKFLEFGPLFAKNQFTKIISDAFMSLSRVASIISSQIHNDKMKHLNESLVQSIIKWRNRNMLSKSFQLWSQNSMRKELDSRLRRFKQLMSHSIAMMNSSPAIYSIANNNEKSSSNSSSSSGGGGSSGANLADFSLSKSTELFLSKQFPFDSVLYKPVSDDVGVNILDSVAYDKRDTVIFLNSLDDVGGAGVAGGEASRRSYPYVYSQQQQQQASNYSSDNKKKNAPLLAIDGDNSVSADSARGSKVILLGAIRRFHSKFDAQNTVLYGGKSKDTIIGYVKLMRQYNGNNMFTDDDVEFVTRFCEITSYAYSSRMSPHSPGSSSISNSSSNNDNSSSSSNRSSDVDEWGLLFPCLNNVIPLLLESLADPNRDFMEVVPQLLQWTKLILNSSYSQLSLNDPTSSNIDPYANSSSNNSDIKQQQQQQQQQQHELTVVTNDGSGLRQSISKHEFDSIDAISYDRIQIVNSSSNNNNNNNNSMSVLLKDPSCASSAVGELKFMGIDADNLSYSQNSIVRVLSYLISAGLSMSSKNRSLATSLEEKDQVVRDLAVEKSTTDLFKRRLMSSLSLLMFMSKASGVSNIDELAVAVSEVLPQILGVSTAVLLVQSPWNILAGSGSSSSSDKLEDGIRVIVPKPPSSGGNSSKSNTNEKYKENKFIPFDQISQIPSYFEAEMFSQSKIDLLRTDMNVYVGLLLLRDEDSSNKLASGPNKVPIGPWKGLEDILSPALTAAVNICFKNMKFNYVSLQSEYVIAEFKKVAEENISLKGTLDKSLQESKNLTQVAGNLTSEIESLQSQFTDKLASTKSDYEQRYVQLDHALNKSKALVGELNNRISELEESSAELNEGKTYVSRVFDDLIDTIREFSGDLRTGTSHTAKQWLEEIVSFRGHKLAVISRSEVGILSGGNGLRGIHTYAEEAIRTNLPLEVFSSAIMGSSESSKGSFVHLVANPCLVPNVACESACFAFIKLVNNKSTGGYSDFEKKFYQCITNLVCRVGSKTTDNLHHPQKNDVKVDELTSMIGSIKNCIEVCNKMWSLEDMSFSKLRQVIEHSLDRILNPSESDKSKICRIQSSMYVIPNQATQPRRQGAGAGGVGSSGGADQNHNSILNSIGFPVDDVDLAMRAMHSKSSHKRGNILIVCVVDEKTEKVLAIIRLEKRVVNDLPNHLSSTAIADEESINVLLVTNNEKFVAETFAQLLLPQFERLKILNEAFDGIQHASQAILTLQNRHGLMEDKLSVNLAHRLEIEECISANFTLLESLNSQRLNASQVLDQVRKNIIATTSSEEVFILLPVLNNVFPGNSFVAQSNNNSNSSSNSSSNYNNNNSSSSSSSISQLSTFYCLKPNHPDIIEVYFEDDDLESKAIKTRKTLSLSASPEGGADSTSCSWAVRAWDKSELDLNISAGNNFEILASPISLFNGTVGLVVALRRLAPYHSTDIECINWSGQILSHCLENSLGDEVNLSSKFELLKSKFELLKCELESKQKELEMQESIISKFKSIIEELASSNFFFTDADDYNKSMEYLVQSLVQLLFSKRNIVDFRVVTAAIATTNEEKASSSSAAAAAFLPSNNPGSNRNSSIKESFLHSFDGKIIYWTSSSSSFHPSADHQEEDTPPPLSENMLSLFIQYQSLPYVQVSLYLEPASCDVSIIKLKLTILSKLMDFLVFWNQQTLSQADNLIKMKQIHASELSRLEDDVRSQYPDVNIQKSEIESFKENYKSELESFKDKHKSELDSFKEKYKTQMLDKVASIKQANKMLLNASICGQMLSSNITAVAVAAGGASRSDLGSSRFIPKSSFNNPNSLLQSQRGAFAQSFINGESSDSAVDLAQIHEFSSHYISSACSILGNSAMFKVLCGRLSVAGIGGNLDKPNNNSGGGSISSIDSSSVTLLINWINSHRVKENFDAHFGSSSSFVKHVSNSVTVSANGAANSYSSSTSSSSLNPLDASSNLFQQPIHYAWSTGRIVIVAPVDYRGPCEIKGFNSYDISKDKDKEKDKNYIIFKGVKGALTKLLDNIQSSSVSKAIEDIAIVRTQDGIEAGSVIVTFSSEESSEAFVIIMKPNIVFEEITKSELSATIVSLLTLKDNILKEIALKYSKAVHMNSLESVKNSKLGAERIGKLSQKNLMMFAFERLKSNRLDFANSKQKLEIDNLIESTKELMSVEQMMADWLEITKGFNKAALGITDGLSGLWSLSSDILYSLLSSHVSARSCGLLIMQGNGKVVELSSRDRDLRGAPQSFEGLADSIGSGENNVNNNSSNSNSNNNLFFNNNTVDVRYATELGEDIYNYIIEVFSGAAGIRKVYTMIPTTVPVGNELYGSKYSGIAVMTEQCWLIPIRSSQTTLGLLRVMVDIQPKVVFAKVPEFSSSGGGDGGKSPSTSRDRADSSRSDALRLAQQAAINFAELFAPLILASQHIDAMKVALSEQDAQIALLNEEKKDPNTQLNIDSYIVRLLVDVLDLCQDLSSKSSPANKFDNHTSSQRDPLSTISFLAQALSQQLSMKWGFVVEISLINESVQMESIPSSFSPQPSQQQKQHMPVDKLDANDLRATASRFGRSSAAAGTFSSSTSKFFQSKSSRVAQDDLQHTNNNNNNNNHSETTAYNYSIINELRDSNGAKFGFFVVYPHRRYSGHVGVRFAKRGGGGSGGHEGLGSDEMDDMFASFTFKDKAELLKLASATISQFLSFTVSSQSNEIKTISHLQGMFSMYEKAIFSSLQSDISEVCSSFCNKLTAMYGVTFCCGILVGSSKSSSSENTSGHPGFHWITSSASSIDFSIHKDMIATLAYASIGSRSKTCVEVGYMQSLSSSSSSTMKSGYSGNFMRSGVIDSSISDQRSNFADGTINSPTNYSNNYTTNNTNMTVNSYPICLSESSDVFGVFQVILPSSMVVDQESSDSRYYEIDSSSAIVSRLICAIISNLKSLEIVPILEAKCRKLESSNAELQLWKVSSLFVTGVCKLLAMGHSIEEILTSEEISKVMASSGIKITISSLTNQNKEGNVLSDVLTSSNSLSLALDATVNSANLRGESGIKSLVVPISEQSDEGGGSNIIIAAVISVDESLLAATNPNPPDFQEKFIHDVMENIVVIIRSSTVICKLKEKENFELIRLHDVTKKRLEKSKAEAKLLRQESAYSSDKYTSLNNRYDSLSDRYNFLCDRYTSCQKYFKQIFLNLSSSLYHGTEMFNERLIKELRRYLASFSSSSSSEITSSFTESNWFWSCFCNIINESILNLCAGSGSISSSVKKRLGTSVHVSILVHDVASTAAADKRAVDELGRPLEKESHFLIFDAVNSEPTRAALPTFLASNGVFNSNSKLEKTGKNMSAVFNCLENETVSSLTHISSSFDVVGIEGIKLQEMKLTNDYESSLISSESSVIQQSHLQIVCLPLKLSDFMMSNGGSGSASSNGTAILRIIHNGLVDDIWTDDLNSVKYSDIGKNASNSRSSTATSGGGGGDDGGVNVESSVPSMSLNNTSNNNTNVLSHNLHRPWMFVVEALKLHCISCFGTFKSSPLLEESRASRVDKAKFEETLNTLTKYRRITKVICRDSDILMDSVDATPGVSGVNKRHPAALSPSIAAQNSCLKILTLVRTLLQSEGQAVIIRDNQSEAGFNVIYTGNAISWSGLSPSTLGKIPSISKSLVESVMATRKTVVVADSSSEAAYNRSVDGVCEGPLPMLFCPLRGQDGATFGALVCVRARNEPTFSTEDIVTADLISVVGSISLYWVQGLKSIHQQLEQSLVKLANLEKSLHHGSSKSK